MGAPRYQKVQEPLRPRSRGAAAAGSSCQTICLGSLDDQPASALGVNVGSDQRRMLGALLAPCGAGQRQMSSNQSGQPSSPPQNVDGARRPELSVSRLERPRAGASWLRLAHKTRHSAIAKTFQCFGFWLLGHKMNCFA